MTSSDSSDSCDSEQRWGCEDEMWQRPDAVGSPGHAERDFTLARDSKILTNNVTTEDKKCLIYSDAYRFDMKGWGYMKAIN